MLEFHRDRIDLVVLGSVEPADELDRYGERNRLQMQVRVAGRERSAKVDAVLLPERVDVFGQPRSAPKVVAQHRLAARVREPEESGRDTQDLAAGGAAPQRRVVLNPRRQLRGARGPARPRDRRDVTLRVLGLAESLQATQSGLALPCVQPEECRAQVDDAVPHLAARERRIESDPGCDLARTRRASQGRERGEIVYQRGH